MRPQLDKPTRIAPDLNDGTFSLQCRTKRYGRHGGLWFIVHARYHVRTATRSRKLTGAEVRAIAQDQARNIIDALIIDATVAVGIKWRQFDGHKKIIHIPPCKHPHRLYRQCIDCGDVDPLPLSIPTITE